MRVRATAVAAAIVLAAAGTQVMAAPSGTITLTGSTSSWTTIDVPSGVTLDVKRMTVSTPGRFGGFYVDAAANHEVGGVWLRGFEPPGEPLNLVHPLGVDTGALPHGRVRMYLIADGPTTVRIPVTGMTSRTIRPATRTSAAASVQELRRTGIGVSGRQPVTAARRSVSISMILLDDTQAFAGTIAVCLTKPEGTCNSGREDSSRFGWYVSPYGAYPFIWSVTYAPGVMSGRLDAVQKAENVAGISYAVGASFTLAVV